MAIQRLEFHGYRSFEKAVWEPGNLNLLVGPNGSGKSNLLRLLELISNVARGKLAESINAAGGMVPLLWNQEAKSLGWTLSIDVDDVFEGFDSVTTHMQLSEFLRSAYRIDTDSLDGRKVSEERDSPAPSFSYELVNDESHIRHNGDEQVISADKLDGNESLLSQGGGVGNYNCTYFARVSITAWGVYYDVDVSQDAQLRQPVITQPSTTVHSDASNLAAVLHTHYTTDRDFKQRIDEGMRAAFGDEFVEIVFQPASAQRIQLAVQWRSSNQPHAGLELSDGTLRFLFLLTVLASPEPAPLIAIDEPEVGLHPSMFPIVAEFAAAAAQRTQIVLSSHSPEFLDAFTEHAPHVTVCHWEDGRTHLFSLVPEKLEKWLTEYRLGHLFTSGDLEALTGPKVDVDDEDLLADLPPEDAPLPPGSVDPEGAASG